MKNTIRELEQEERRLRNRLEKLDNTKPSALVVGEIIATNSRLDKISKKVQKLILSATTQKVALKKIKFFQEILSTYDMHGEERKWVLEIPKIVSWYKKNRQYCDRQYNYGDIIKIYFKEKEK